MVDLKRLTNTELVQYIKATTAGTIENYCAVKELCYRSDQIIKEQGTNDHISTTRKTPIYTRTK